MPRRPPSAARRIASFVLTGPVVGALVYVGLFGWSLVRFSATSYMGVSDAAVIDRVVSMFTAEIVLLQVQILGLYVAIGALAGLLARLHWQVVDVLRGGDTDRWGAGLVLRVAIVVGCYHLWFLGRTLVTHPQALADAFHGAGGIWRTIQVTLTDFIPPDAFDSLAFAYLTVIAGGAIIGCHRRYAEEASLFWAGPGRRWLAIVLCGVATAVGVTLALQPDPAEPTDDNLLIIAVDSLRPDRLDENAARPLPNLRALSRGSVRFTNAWTVMPRTFPSWVSILTGRYPHEHGIRHMFPGPAKLAEPRATVFSRLRDAGYRTAVISDFAGDVFSRIELGFEEVRVPRFTLRANVELAACKLHYHLVPYLLTVPGARARFPILKLWERVADPAALTDEVRRWLDDRDERPFALLVFYSAPHFPYAVPWPWYKAWTRPDYDGDSRYHKAVWTGTSEAPDEAEQEQIRGLYDAALLATDHAIGELLSELDSAGLLDKTHIVLTADHGENLYEAGFGVGHGDHLRGVGSLRIPLLLRQAGGRLRRTVHAAVRSIDIAPTLLEILGAEPLDDASGVSVKGLADGTAQRLEDPPIFFETGLWFISPEAEVLEGRTMTFAEGFGAYIHDPDTWEIYFDESFDDDFLVAKHRAILHDGYKLIYIPTRHGVIWELYDTRNDPLERRNLVEERPELADKLRRQLRDWMLSDPTMVPMGEYVVPQLDYR